MNKAIFLDRDGVINIDYGYVYNPNNWVFTINAIDAIRKINKKNYLAIVITNQSGIGRGFYTEKDMLDLHNYVDGLLRIEDAHIDAYYWCPHTPASKCSCRKPNLELFQRAIVEHNVDISNSIVIGDKISDIQNVHKLGCTKTCLVGRKNKNHLIFDSFYDAINYWLT